MKSNVTGKFNHFRITLTAIMLFSMLVTIPASPVHAAGRCYVKFDATGSESGLSWTNAYAGEDGLQQALGNVGCTSIWVAAGTYNPGTSSTDTFQLKNNVAIYGGFNGTETALNDRAIVQNETFLSGEIGNTSSVSDNSYHVVNGSGTNSTAVLNGFTIQGGYADGGSPYNSGGGIYIDAGTPSIQNVVMQDNYALGAGGGMYIKNSNFGLTALSFLNNEAVTAGGGLYNLSSDITLSNSTFWRNKSANGAAIFNNGSSPTFNNLTIYEHPYGGSTTAAIHNTNATHLTMHNSIIWDTFTGSDVYVHTDSTATITYSVIEDGCPTGATCTNIITSEPATYNLSPRFHGGNMKVNALLPYSSAINAGDNATCASQDQRGFSRAGQGACDIGAYEFYPTVFVKPGGATKGFCSSWGAACELSYADDVLASGMEAWVQAGTYKPGSLRTDTFKFGLGYGGNNGGGVYGGFNGTETARSQRDPQANPTILSGDIGTPGVNGDNSYHVVYITSAISFTLDGFTITKGYTNDSLGEQGDGGGIFIYPIASTLESKAVTLRNLTISSNRAYNEGGGLNIAKSGYTILDNVTLLTNLSLGAGGGLYKAENGTVVLKGVTFDGNQAATGGGAAVIASSSYPVSLSITDTSYISNTSVGIEGGAAIRADYSDLSIINSTFYASDAANSGDNSIVCILGCGAWSFTNITMQYEDGIRAAQNGNLTLRNSTLWNGSNLFNGLFDTLSISDSVLEGGCPAGASCSSIYTTDPKLGTLGNYGGKTQTIPLLADSSAIDSANDTYCPKTDQRGVARPQRFHCDSGAYEVKDSTLTFKSQPKYDGWVLESSEFSGKGGTRNNLGKVLLLGDNAQDKQYRAILSFGTAGIPDNAVITKVILKVKKAGVAGTNPMRTHNGLVVDIKKGKFYTLPALQINDFQAKPGKFRVGKFPKKLFPGNWYRAVLYTGAYDYINVKGRTQLRLRFLLDDNDDNSADILKLFSGNAILAYRPKLIINYYVP